MVFWITVGSKVQENYETGVESGVWGVVADYQHRIEGVSEGDYILFYGSSVRFALHRVMSPVFRDERSIWDDDDYPFRVLISDPLLRDQETTFGDIYDCLRSSVGQGPPYSSVSSASTGIRGMNGVFRPLSDPEVACLFGRLGWSGTAGREDTTGWIDRALSLEDFEIERTVKTRAEQGYVRRRLLGGREVGTCVICGTGIPATLLVAAHIKRRSECTDEEKADFDNNVALMCSLGCDPLFERGYIYVEEGIIRTREATQVTEEVENHLSRLEGRRCLAWNSGSEPYFQWHRMNSWEG